jgi:hypothetical protein
MLPSGDRVVCGEFSGRYEGVDEVELYLPLGTLVRVDRRIGGFPFDERSGAASLSWRAPLDRWLADVAAAVYADVPFHRALIGFELDDDADPGYAATLLPAAEGLVFRPATA